MKRFWTILLSLVLTLSLAACGQGPASSGAEEQSSSDSASQAENGETETPAPAVDGETGSTDEETQQAAGDDSAAQTPDETPAEDGAASEDPAPEDSPTQSDLDALTAVLDQIRTDGRVGTAGSSLTNAYLAATLLDWAEETPLTEEECTSTTAEWYDLHAAEMDSEQIDVFYAVSSSCEELMTEGQEGLLSDCGYTGGGYPWSEAAGARALAALRGVTGG